MKKTLIAGFAGLLAASVFAGSVKDNVVVTFYTQGLDTYADGTTVVDGEYYALVWTPAGSEFAGINADGTAVAPSKVALKAPLAKGGKCPYVKFELSADTVESQYSTDGTWGVYLLDTRKFVAAEDGTAAATGSTGSAVNGYGLATTADFSTMGGFAAASANTVAQNAISADKLNAKITSIKVADGFVYITVAGTVSTANYALKAGDTPTAQEEVKTQAGNTTGDMIIVREAKAGGEFFSVNRK